MVSGFSPKDACTLHQWDLDSYAGQMSDDSTLKSSMNTNAAYRGLTHPMKQEADGLMPDLKYRYVSEDVPTGLCFTKGLAELLEVPTPTMDKVLLWARWPGPTSARRAPLRRWASRRPMTSSPRRRSSRKATSSPRRRAPRRLLRRGV